MMGLLAASRIGVLVRIRPRGRHRRLVRRLVGVPCQLTCRFVTVFDAVGSPFVCEVGFEDPLVSGDVGGGWIYFLDCSVEIQL